MTLIEYRNYTDLNIGPVAPGGQVITTLSPLIEVLYYCGQGVPCRKLH